MFPALLCLGLSGPASYSPLVRRYHKILDKIRKRSELALTTSLSSDYTLCLKTLSTQVTTRISETLQRNRGVPQVQENGDHCCTLGVQMRPMHFLLYLLNVWHITLCATICMMPQLRRRVADGTCLSLCGFTLHPMSFSKFLFCPDLRKVLPE